MREFVSILATCRNFRQVVVVRFFRTTTKISECLTNPVVRNFRTAELQFAGLKNNIADHFRDLTKLVGVDYINYGEFATINRLSLTTNHF